MCCYFKTGCYFKSLCLERVEFRNREDKTNYRVLNRSNLYTTAGERNFQGDWVLVLEYFKPTEPFDLLG